MSAQIVKKVSAPYLLFAANAEPTIFTVGTAATHNAEMTVNGNLTVLGTHTTISTTDTSIYDNVITLNAGLKPTDPPVGLMAGIEVNRGAGDPTSPDGFTGNATLRWNESIHRWEITNDGGLTFSRIATIAAGKTYISDIVEDLTPQLGGNLDTNGSTITSVYPSNVVVDPAVNLQVTKPIQLIEQTVTPPVVAGEGLIYAGPVDGGGTGLYVTHSTEVNQELISKKKAILYSLIF